MWRKTQTLEIILKLGHSQLLIVKNELHQNFRENVEKIISKWALYEDQKN